MSTVENVDPPYDVERHFVRELDARSAVPLSQLFRTDGQLDGPGGVKDGRSEIHAYYDERFVQFGPSQHFITLVDQREDGSGSRKSDWNFFALLGQADGASALAFGTYTFDVDGNERIEKLVVRVNNTFELGYAIPFQPPEPTT